jgi:hypothetical protein
MRLEDAAEAEEVADGSDDAASPSLCPLPYLASLRLLKRLHNVSERKELYSYTNINNIQVTKAC